jgi:hypothetical protein
MTRVTNRKVLKKERKKKERKKKERKDAEQFSMPYGGTSNWRIDTKERILFLHIYGGKQEKKT